MIYGFGDYEFDLDRHELRRRNVTLHIEPKVFELLAYLLQRRGQFVTREELYTQLWPEQFVSDAALSYCVTKARQAVGDTGRAQRLIKMVYGRGYCFIAPVQEILPHSTLDSRTPLAESVATAAPFPEVQTGSEDPPRLAPLSPAM